MTTFKKGVSLCFLVVAVFLLAGMSAVIAQAQDEMRFNAEEKSVGDQGKDFDLVEFRMSETYRGIPLYEYFYPVEANHPLKALFPDAELYEVKYTDEYLNLLKTEEETKRASGAAPTSDIHYTNVYWTCLSGTCSVADHSFTTGYYDGNVKLGASLKWLFRMVSEGTFGGVTGPWPVTGDYLSEIFDWTDVYGNTTSFEMRWCQRFTYNNTFIQQIPVNGYSCLGTYVFHAFAWGPYGATPNYLYAMPYRTPRMVISQ